LGFDQYQVRSPQAIQRSVLLSFVAASLTQLIAWPPLKKRSSKPFPLWRTAYNRWTPGQTRQQVFSLSMSSEGNKQKIEQPYAMVDE
jgi:hypothetical protein